jgi:subtilisin family serine protease
MIAAGVLPVTAAGNVSNSACLFSPSRVSETLVAGASTDRDERASFSGRCGCVDLFAPGANVYSATIYRLDRKGNHGYSYKSGTSMAAPHAAGVAAIYLSQNPGASPADVHGALVANATPGVLELNTSASFCGADGDTPNLLLYTEPASPVGPGKK